MGSLILLTLPKVKESTYKDSCNFENISCSNNENIYLFLLFILIKFTTVGNNHFGDMSPLRVEKPLLHLTILKDFTVNLLKLT